ncbi:MAG: PTS sugar transporter subunit IIA [Pseudomonadota bacterium]
MIGLVIVTHGRLANEFRSALEHVVGQQEHLETVAIGPDDDMDKRRSEILTKIKAVDTGKGVAVLTDMFGGTPSNLAISVMNETGAEVVAGVNLPLLIKLAGVRGDHDLATAVDKAKEAGRKYVTVASQLLDTTQ